MREETVLGSSMTVFARRPRSVVELLLQGAEEFGQRPYVVFPNRSFTFDSIVAPIAAVAAGLQEDYGIRPGDRVAILSANRAEYVLAFWATVALGAVAVGFNGWWTATEIRYAAELTAPKVLLADTRRLERLAGESLAGIALVNLESDLERIERSGAGAAFPDVRLNEDDPFVVLFTSGTTGRPKGAMISHRSNIHFGLATQLQAAAARVRSATAGHTAQAPPAPCTISASPMFHISGLTCTLVLAPGTGLTLVYPPPGRWSETTHLELTETHRATTWSLVPAQLWRILMAPSLDEYDLSSLMSIGGGSSVWPPELLRQLEAKLPGVRPALSTGYGMTETNGLGTSLRGADSYEHPHSVGRPSPTVEVEVRDPVTREALPDNAVGEIALRTAATFVGYWRNSAATSAALDADRWYHTGDFGYIGDGCLYLEGRRQDLIIRGGENVYPAEVENRLFEHPDISDAAVVGVEEPVLGQTVKAYVVVAPGSALTTEQVVAWCAETLAAFKIPSSVEFVTTLPRNASYKVVRHLLGAESSAPEFVEE